ncbi:uncharacterized protein LOC111715875 [Eurytemora carolleeae]|uniref:uncharacterized protein LOC111715875 n=1 Tax=Eurytemora carolleeae TaxID=1294199 RepID=UPI000C78CB4C|nr:uncharacterized protein LOC111715875 [Eurytemora carolleeae]|eukprot:XP_023347041.1 uncharacterized protein LOC111715875 [Eurytemora affinis]
MIREDGRSNYAWDLAKLNINMMTYTYPGDKLKDFAVFGEKVYLPMNGKVITAVKKEIDNPPDLSAAVDLMDHDSGDGIDLQEKPQNMIEVEIGGEGSSAMLRLLHLQQDSIPDTIQVGKNYLAGTLLGLAGNSGTTYTPHLHLVFGFWDNSSRFWSLPIEFESVEHRILLPYPSGYEYSNYHQHEFLYPKLGYCIKSA